MYIKLKGLQRCNLFVGGDRRDKSLQSALETPHDLFLIKKTADGWFEVRQVEEVDEPIVVAPTPLPVSGAGKKKKKDN